MSTLTKVCCVDFGATKVNVEVLELTDGYDFKSARPTVRQLAVQKFSTTKPDNPDEDYRQLQQVLGTFKAQVGFDAVCVGMAARFDENGTVQKGGNLSWAGRNIKAMIERDCHVPTTVGNDSAMFAADELVFESLRGDTYDNRDGLVIVPGTGIAICHYFWHKGQAIIRPSEGAHMLYDATKTPNGCHCQSYCFESEASGAAYERAGIDPVSLSEAEDVAHMAPPLGRLVANIVKLQPQIDVVVVSGRIANKRHSLTAAIEQAATDELHGYIATPEFILGPTGIGGTKGCLAYWLITNGQPGGNSSRVHELA